MFNLFWPIFFVVAQNNALFVDFDEDDLNCGISAMGLPDRKILNGKNYVEGDWPWAVHLSIGCSGSIISTRHVLTAAHCAYTLDQNGEIKRITNGTAIIGRNRKRHNRQKLRIKNIFTHPSYDPDDFSTSDIAIIELDGKLKFDYYVKKICLPSNFNEYYGQIALIVGWGADFRTDGTNSIENAQETMIPINHPEQCINFFEKIQAPVFFDSRKYICGGGILRGTEEGDSGGPLMINERGRWFQVGITAFGEMDRAVEGYYDVGAYTRIAEHCNWIASVTKGETHCIDFKNIYQFARRRISFKKKDRQNFDDV